MYRIITIYSCIGFCIPHWVMSCTCAPLLLCALYSVVYLCLDSVFAIHWSFLIHRDPPITVNMHKYVANIWARAREFAHVFFFWGGGGAMPTPLNAPLHVEEKCEFWHKRHPTECMLLLRSTCTQYTQTAAAKHNINYTCTGITLVCAYRRWNNSCHMLSSFFTLFAV